MKNMKEGVAKELQGIKEEPMEDDQSEIQGAEKFDSKKFKKSIKSTGMKKEGGKSDETDIPNDPFFLTKYRSFHNHDLDSNYVEHAHLVMDEELHKKGSANLLP